MGAMHRLPTKLAGDTGRFIAGNSGNGVRAFVPIVPSVPPAFLENEDGAGIDPEWDDADLWDVGKLLVEGCASARTARASTSSHRAMS